MRMFTLCLVGLLTVAAAVGRGYIQPRFNLPTETGVYEALVHIFLGFLLGLACMAPRGDKLKLFGCFLALTALETGMFIHQKKLHEQGLPVVPPVKSLIEVWSK